MEDLMSLRTSSTRVDSRHITNPTQCLYTMSELVRLHEQWIDCQNCFVRYDGEWTKLVQTGSQLLDDDMDRLEGIMTLNRKAWLYLTRIMHKCAFALFTCLSILVIWSELEPILASSMFLSLHSTWKSIMLSNWIHSLIQSNDLSIALVISLIILVYMTLCMSSSLFKFTFFQHYKLVPGHCTNIASLLFLTNYTCRLVFSLCYHFFNLLDSPGSDSSLSSHTCFIQLMGSINLVPFLGTRYYLFVPLFILFTCIIVLFRLDAVIVSWFGLHPLFESYYFSNLHHASEDQVSMIQENTERGKRLIRQSRSLINSEPSFISSLMRHS